MAFGGSGNGKDLGGAEDLTKALILKEEKSFVVAVVELGQHKRAADGAAKFIAGKRRNAAGVHTVAVVKEIASVERGIADEFEQAAVIVIGSGLGDDVGETGGAFADFGRHDAGTGLHFLDGVHIEVGESGATKFRVAGIRAIGGEDGSDAALAVDGELLGEVGGTVGVGHGASSEEKQLAEVALVKREARNLFAGEAESAGGFGGRVGRGCKQGQGLVVRRKLKIDVELCVLRDEEQFRRGPDLTIGVDGEAIAAGVDVRKGESAIFRSGGVVCG